MINVLWYALAALTEIFGCYAFWLWLREGRTPLWALAGVVSLIVFGLSLTRIDTTHAGRAYAAYGGVYIAASLLWLFAVEHVRPTTRDWVGAAVAVAGAAIILSGRQ